MARKWADGTYTNYGLRLSSTGGSDPTYDRRFCSRNPDTNTTCNTATRTPYLSVTYNQAPTPGAAAPSVGQPTAGTTKISAVVTDPDGTTPWAEFTIRRGAVAVFRGLSTSGTGTTQFIDAPPLPKGQYTVSARAYDGRLFSSNSTPSASFNVADDVDEIVGDSFAAATSTQVASITIPGAVPDPEAEGIATAEQFIQIAGVGGVPDDEQTGHAAVVSMVASGWSSAGGVSVVNPDGEVPAAPNLGITTSMHPSVAIASTSIVGLSEDGEVAVVNTSPDPIAVVVSVQGRFESPIAAPVAAPVGPQVEAGVISNAPARGAATVEFTPPVAEAYALAVTTGGQVSMSVGGTLLGQYMSHAVDEAGHTVPATITADAGKLVVTVTPSSAVEYPITVLPTFEAANPASGAVQELYPEPEVPLDPDEAPLTPQDIVEVVDEASQEFVSDLQNPDEGIAPESGQLTTMAASAPAKARVPKWTRFNGSKIWPKYYIYDPKNKNRRNPERRSWHDYCSGKVLNNLPNIGAPDSARFNYTDSAYNNYVTPTVSFKGPCARHDLCIQYKQTPQNSYGRYYCDDEFKTHIRINCRYYIRADKYPKRKPGLSACYRRANLYHGAVRKSTKGNTAYGHWGHNQYASVFPTYRYDDWIQ